MCAQEALCTELCARSLIGEGKAGLQPEPSLSDGELGCYLHSFTHERWVERKGNPQAAAAHVKGLQAAGSH